MTADQDHDRDVAALERERRTPTSERDLWQELIAALHSLYTTPADREHR